MSLLFPRVRGELESSKGFDRVIPQLICELGGRLGLDKGFLRAWCSVYVGFKRFVTCGALISKNCLESKNGIAQDDCASVYPHVCLDSPHGLLYQCSELHFHWWCLCWCRTKTHPWVGCSCESNWTFWWSFRPSLNLSKSCAWGTTQKARSLMKQHCPQMLWGELVQVLGGNIKANARPHVANASSKFHLIKTLIDTIGNLPISFRAKSKIFAIKVSPMIAFASEINPWMKKHIDAFTSSISKALWKTDPIGDVKIFSLHLLVTHRKYTLLRSLLQQQSAILWRDAGLIVTSSRKWIELVNSLKWLVKGFWIIVVLPVVLSVSGLLLLVDFSSWISLFSLSWIFTQIPSSLHQGRYPSSTVYLCFGFKSSRSLLSWFSNSWPWPQPNGPGLGQAMAFEVEWLWWI